MNMFILTDLAICWKRFQATQFTVWGGVLFFYHIFLLLFFLCCIYFSGFCHSFSFIFSFSFLINSFLAFSVSICFTILKFSSVIIQNDLKTLFLFVIFLMKDGIAIRSSKEILLPILKILFLHVETF